MTRARILADYVSGGTTAAEFDYMDGVTSNIQTQLDAKAPLASPTFTGTVAIPNVANLETAVVANTAKTSKILQLLSTTVTAATATITTADTWALIAGMTVTITPSSASNKIFISWAINVGGDDEDVIGIRMLRDDTPIGVGTAAGLRYSVWGTYRSMGAQSYEVSPMCGEFLDSPSSTSAIVYKLGWILPEGSSTFYLNRPFNDANNADRSRSASTITVMEVAA